MTSVELRRPTSALDVYPSFAMWMDAALGNMGGRLWLVGDDDGNQFNPISPAAATATNTYRSQVRSGGANHLAALLSATAAKATPTTSNSVMLVQDAALSVGSGKAFRLYATAGTNNGQLTSDANGLLTLNGTGTGAGTLSLTILNASSYVAIGATPALSGALRLTNAQAINARGGAVDVAMLTTDASNNVLLGDITNAPTTRVQALTDIRLKVGAVDLATLTATSLNVDANTFVVDITNNKVAVGAVPISTDGVFQVTGLTRVIGASPTYPTTGRGLELVYDSGTPYGQVRAYNAAGGTYELMVVDGSDVAIRYQTTPRFRADVTGIGFFNTGPAAQQTVSGVRTGTLGQLQTVVQHILTAGVNYGFWLDTTT